MGHDVDLMAA